MPVSMSGSDTFTDTHIIRHGANVAEDPTFWKAHDISPPKMNPEAVPRYQSTTREISSCLTYHLPVICMSAGGTVDSKAPLRIRVVRRPL